MDMFTCKATLVGTIKLYLILVHVQCTGYDCSEGGQKGAVVV